MGLGAATGPQFSVESVGATKMGYLVNTFSVRLCNCNGDLPIMLRRRCPGLPPDLASLPELLSKQALFFASVTLPAMAVASLVRSFTHFVIAAFLVACMIAVAWIFKTGYRLKN